MKKKFGLLFAVIIMSIMFAMSANALESTGQCGDNVYWNYNSSTGELVISGAGDMANYGVSNSPFFNSNVRSVVIKEGVTAIGDFAFRSCTKLVSITIPDSVVAVGEDAFAKTAYYNDVNNWEKGVLYIGKHLLDADYSISGDYKIKTGTVTIADSAFNSCSNLTSVTIPNSVMTIGDEAFYYCTALTDVTIGNGVATIGDSSFYNCKSLIKITVGSSVKSIGTQAFNDCSALEGVYITDVSAWCNIDFSSYVSNPLYYAKNLYVNGKLATNITIPDSTTKINKYAFYKCTSLKSVVIGKNVTYIGESAFDYCGEIISFTFGENIEKIDTWAFAECNKLESVYITNLSAWCNIDFGHRVSNPLYYADDLYLDNQLITELIIPNDITNIKDYSFVFWKNLTSVTIPNSVTNIGVCAFDSCQNLVSITIPKTITAIGVQAFNDCDKMKYIFYSGYESDWNNISIERLNEPLLNATIHYNSTAHISTTEWITDSEPTCTKDGSKSHRCTICSAKTDTTVIPALGHSPSTEWTIDAEPTCTKNGSRSRHCTVCSGKTDVTKIGALGHWLESDVCIKCDKSLSDILSPVVIRTGVLESSHNYANNTNETKTFTVVGADYVEVAFSYSTSVENGYDKIYIYDYSDSLVGTYTGTILANKTIKVNGNTVKIKLTSDGSTTKYGYTATCKGYDLLDCNDHLHKKFSNQIDADCENSGYSGDVVCIVCETVVKCGNIISAFGHNYISEILIPATHLAEGVKTFTCECGDTYDESIAKLEGHTHVPTVTKEATHLEEGTLTYTCECGDTYDEPIDKITEHRYKETIIVPTCSEKGYSEFKCECGDYYITNYIGVKPHTYGYSVVRQATHLTEGKGVYTCSVCGDNYDETIPKTKVHTYESIVIPASCESEGYTEYFCQCGDSYKGDYIAKTAHRDDNKDIVCDNCGSDISETCNCACHKSGIAAVVWKIFLFFYKLFRSNDACSCGMMHY